MPEVTALNGTKWSSVSAAMIRARVVLPVPGGPQKISDGTRPEATAWRRKAPSPATRSCPTTSSSVRGRMRSASGVPAAGWPSSGASGTWSSNSPGMGGP